MSNQQLLGHPAHDWRLGFHLMPPHGKMGDPNGLSYCDGCYHVFFQYSPDAQRAMGWGHFSSSDLVSWTFEGEAIAPDTPADANGAYSGSAIAQDGNLTLFYTGNVKVQGDFDYISEGRMANELAVSFDPVTNTLGPKRVLLENSDYPSWCSCHVRDPKVWQQDERWWMLLGARTRDDKGCVLLYGSTDGEVWTAAGSATTRAPFGYMWECPNMVRVDGREYLLICPQGLGRTPFSNQNLHNVGYFALNGRLIDLMREGGNPLDAQGPHICIDEGTYHEFDFGFDFYAPQALYLSPDEGTDSDGALDGRTLIYGWVGEPDPDKQYATPTHTWTCAQSAPRELHVSATGKLCQLPAKELYSLRARELEVSNKMAQILPTRFLNSNSSPFAAFNVSNHVGTLVPSGLADIEIEGLEEAQVGHILINYDLELLITPQLIELAFTSQAGAGRCVRRLKIDELSAGFVQDIRMLVDHSLVEIFINGGEVVLTTRYFPQEVENLQIFSDLLAQEMHVYEINEYPIEGLMK